MATMSSKRDYYEVLGVARTASAKEIADAYRALARQYHPDRYQGDSREEAVAKFKEAAEAFEVLHDTDKRARYDRFGHQGVDGGGAHFHDLNDIFSAFGDMFGEGLFGDLFGGGGRRRSRVRRGSDVRTELTIELIDAARGIKKTIEYERESLCTDCQGTGAQAGSQPTKCDYCGGAGQVIQRSGIIQLQTTCPACRGAGTVVRDKCRKCRGGGMTSEHASIEVQIPPGIDNGMELRLTGQGGPSPNGGPQGDLYLAVHVREHPFFERDGQHLICHVPITYSQAVLGASVEVPTLDGREKLTIPPGTSSGHAFSLRGRGMPSIQGRRTNGDLVVQVSIDVPREVSKEQEKLLRDLAELEQADVTPHRKNFFEKLRDYFVPSEEESKPDPTPKKSAKKSKSE